MPTPTQKCCKPACPELATVILAVPALMESLGPQARSAVSACNRQLRSFVHSSTEVIHLDDVSNISHISKSSWPQLALVTLPKQDECIHPLLSSIHSVKLPYTAVLQLTLSGMWSQFQEVLVVDSWRHCRSTFQHQSPLARCHPAFQHLSNLRYRFLGSVVLSNSSLDADGIAQLAAAHWPNLFCLDVSDNQLDSEALGRLAQGSWPKLEALDASLNRLDTAAVAELVKGAWPKLTELRLSASTVIDPAAPGGLEGANQWPLLEQLDLVCSMLSADAILKMGRATWTNLGLLDLRCAGVNAASLAALGKGDWPALNFLCLDGNELGPEAVASLVAALLPELRSLHLSENKLDAAAARHLASGNWPRLKYLLLQDNNLANDAMEWLAQGQWPGLTYLHLECNQLDAVGIQALTEGQWSLMELTLDVSTASAATWAILSLDALYLSFFTAETSKHCSYSVPRLLQWLPSDQEGAWPHLNHVDFSKMPSEYRPDGSRAEPRYSKQWII